MEVLNRYTCQEVSGGDALATLGYVGLVGLTVALFSFEAYLIEQERVERERIDFSQLTPKEAYDLGVTHSFLYCRHF
jgi:hypothetical protein